MTKAIQVTTAKNCPVNCYPYCPQLKFREIYGDRGDFLSLADWKTALSHMTKDVQVQFAGFSEPFVNSRAIDMIEFTKAAGYWTEVYTTLVGLRAADVPRLKCVDKFILHLPDNRNIAHVGFTPNYVATLLQVLKTLDIFTFTRMDANFIACDRAGFCDGADPKHVSGPFYCCRLVAPELVMLPNCDVVLCCMDWSMKHLLGNLKTQTFDEIIQSKESKRLVRQRWALDGDAICRQCSEAESLPRAVVRWAYVYAKREWWR